MRSTKRTCRLVRQSPIRPVASPDKVSAKCSELGDFARELQENCIRTVLDLHTSSVYEPLKPGGNAVRRANFRPPSTRRKKLAGSAAFAILAILAAMFGALSGLLLIYTVDLPQIQDLERYRPNTTTVLYDVHGNQIGSFALERRIVVGYDDIPPVLRHAVISIEDKNFESHWGVNLFRVAGAAYRDLTDDRRAQGASTLTMQLAREPVSLAGAVLSSQTAGSVCSRFRLSGILPSSRFLLSMPTRSIWARACMGLRPDRNITSASMRAM